MINKLLCWMWGHQFIGVITYGEMKGMIRTSMLKTVCKHCGARHD